MVWQRTGTVAVQNGSSTVIGTDVDFAASSRNGDSFIGPDGVSYELANVASSTVISILPAYKGPTASGADYAIMPVQGYDKLLSDTFNTLVNQFGAQLAALGTTGNYDVLPLEKGGTGSITQAGARSSLGLGAVSVENILPVEKGGNGNATGTALRLAAAAIVGAVSQSGGAPTGAIIERGTSSAGSYTKFADGTAFCWAILTFTQSLTFAQDGFFIGATPVLGLPLAFISPPVITFSARSTTVVSQPSVITATTYQGLIMSMTSRTLTADFIMTAQGRWY